MLGADAEDYGPGWYRRVNCPGRPGWVNEEDA